MPFRTSWTSTTASNPKAITIAPSVGDFLIAFAVTDTASAGDLDSTPSGWTQAGRGQSTNDNMTLQVIYKVADGTETSVSFNSSSGNTAIGAVGAYTGVNLAFTLDVAVGTFQSNSAAAATDINISTLTDGCLMVMVQGQDAGNSNYNFTFTTLLGATTPWATNIDINSGFYNAAAGSATQVYAGPITARCTSTSGGRYGVLFALRSATQTIPDGLGDWAWWLLAGAAPFDPSTSLVGMPAAWSPRLRSFVQIDAAVEPILPPGVASVTFADGQGPSSLPRPGIDAALHQTFASTSTDRNAPLAPPAFPESVRRPAMPVSRQQASALHPAPDERTVPWSAATTPEAVRRPGMLAAEQMAASPRELAPERPLPYSDGIEPEAVRRVLEHARHQQPIADPTYGWALVAAAPNITPPAWPDSVRRPAIPVAEQRADAPRVPIDRPFPQVDGSTPAEVRRQRMHASEQQALAAPPALPDPRTVQWSASTAPDTVRRPVLAASQQRAWMDPTYAQFLVVVPTITPPAFPEAVRRPTFRTEQQRAFTATTTTDRPYPQFAPAVAPDRVYRPQFLAALQQALALQPRPERVAPLAAVSVPDRVERPTMRAALQQAHSEPQYTDRGVPWWCVVVPDRVLRATLPVAEQLAAVGMRVPDAPVPAPDLVALCYPASVSSVIRLTVARMLGVFMPPWNYTNPARPAGRSKATPSDVQLDTGDAGDAILSMATPSDYDGPHGDPSDE